MRVVTPNPLVQDGIDVQEFLVAPAAVVPAPAAAVLFGSALAALGTVRRRTAAR
jgi:hypothetical protein